MSILILFIHVYMYIYYSFFKYLLMNVYLN